MFMQNMISESKSFLSNQTVWKYCFVSFGFLLVVLCITGNLWTTKHTAPFQRFLTDNNFKNGELLEQNELQNKHKHLLGRRCIEKTAIPKTRIKRNGILSPLRKWPNGRVPYELSTPFTQTQLAVLARGIKEYKRLTCIRIEPRSPGDYNYVSIGKDEDCSSSAIGMAGGKQLMSLADECFEYISVIHEFMHVIGFWHEPQRWDRDQYVQIIWQNVDDTCKEEYDMVYQNEASNYGEPYDYKSIMHYERNSCSKYRDSEDLNGVYMFGNTIVARPNNILNISANMATYITYNVMGEARNFSQIDINKINKMYNCPGSGNVINEEKSNFNPACKDKASDCILWKDKCSEWESQLVNFMQLICAKTCRYCN